MSWREATPPLRGDLPAAVVVGLDNLTGLQTARILRARGIPVVGIASDRSHWAARTNACIDIVESPLTGDELVSCLLRVGDQLGQGSVLVPCTDQSVATLSLRRRELQGRFILSLAPHAVVELLMDKTTFARHARAVGLPVPRTEILTSRADTVAIAPLLTYPCIVKPALKSATWTSRTKAKGIAVQDQDDLLYTYDEVSAWTPELIVQEWVVGPEEGLVSCNAYFGEGGQPLATFVARKVRQWPPEIGISASGEECRNDKVLETALRLFGGLDYRGLAYLEMKRDGRSGRMVIIEPNVGRPTGRSAIAEAGGVELLYTAYCDAVGLPLPSAREQRYAGAKWLDLRHDLQAAVVAHRKGTITVREWLRSLRGPKAHAVWSRQDPAPFVVDVAQALGRGSRALVAGRRAAAVRESSKPTNMPILPHVAAARPRLTGVPEEESS